MSEITKISEAKGRWYPVSIDALRGLLSKVIEQGHGFIHITALRNNIAYNLQYLEYTDRCMTDLSLTGVIKTQNIKIFVIVGCSIIESLLTFLLIRRDLYSKSDWELQEIYPGNPKNIDGNIQKIDSHIYKKLSTPKMLEMTFDAMLKKAEARKVFGKHENLYPRLNYLRGLRNKVHIQLIKHSTDTDWNSFGHDDMKAMSQVLHLIFTGNIFRPSQEERGYFEYLVKYFQS